MHVMHPRRAGRHAGQARQAAVDMQHRLFIRVAVILQHVLDQVDTAPRTVELVAQHLIGRTGRGAEPAMHAGSQDLVGPRDFGIGQLLGRELGLHEVSIGVISPGLRMPRGSNLRRKPVLQRGHRCGPAAGTSRGCGRPGRAWHARRAWRRRRGSRRTRAGTVGHQQPDQPAAPVVKRLGARQIGDDGRRVVGCHRQPPDIARTP